jgi:hypothetical protein
MFQKQGNPLNILGDREVTCSKFHTVQTKSITVHNLVAWATGRPGFVHPPPPPNDMTLLSIVLNGVVLISLSGLMKQH